MSDVTDKNPEHGSKDHVAASIPGSTHCCDESDIGYIKRDVGELKSDVKELRRDDRTDFRRLFGAIVLVALGLAGSWPKGSFGCER